MTKNINLNTTDKIINWAQDTLNVKTTDSADIVDTPWFKVLKITSKEEILYLKQTPEDLFAEPEVIRVIQKHMNNSDRIGLTQHRTFDTFHKLPNAIENLDLVKTLDELSNVLFQVE